MVNDDGMHAFLLSCCQNRYIYPANFQADLEQIFAACKADNKLINLANLPQLMPKLVEECQKTDSESPTINLMLDNLEDYIDLEQMARSGQFERKSGLVAERYLTLINTGQLNFLWISNLLRDLLPENPSLICGVIERAQEQFVDYSQIRGDDRVEIAFR